jgi:ribonuclease HII
MPDFSYEQELIDRGYLNVAGVDECSRGSLIGPVYAGAVILAPDMLDFFAEYVKDSKKMSEKKRGEICDIITHSCMWSIGEASSQEIDDLNILQATKLAMYRAVNGISKADFLLIDGNMSFQDVFDLPYTSIVKGDDKSLSIAAASIVAKTYQVAQMKWFDRMYPGYGLAQNRGYGTVQHCKAIEKLGPCEIHRKSFNRVKEYC